MQRGFTLGLGSLCVAVCFAACGKVEHGPKPQGEHDGGTSGTANSSGGTSSDIGTSGNAGQPSGGTTGDIGGTGGNAGQSSGGTSGSANDGTGGSAGDADGGTAGSNGGAGGTIGSAGEAGDSGGGSAGASGTPCGNEFCKPTEFCDNYTDGCGISEDDHPHCSSRNGSCNFDTPVCGCDGEVYESECAAHQAGHDIGCWDADKAPQGRFACGPWYCDPRTTYCWHGQGDVDDHYMRCEPFPTECNGVASCDCLPLSTECDTCSTVKGNGVTGIELKLNLVCAWHNAPASAQAQR